MPNHIAIYDSGYELLTIKIQVQEFKWPLCSYAL